MNTVILIDILIPLLLFLMKDFTVKTIINPFSTNVPIMDKPGNWFLLPKCLKNTCGRVLW